MGYRRLLRWEISLCCRLDWDELGYLVRNAVGQANVGMNVGMSGYGIGKSLSIPVSYGRHSILSLGTSLTSSNIQRRPVATKFRRFS
jgi:hypothetical protein